MTSHPKILTKNQCIINMARLPKIQKMFEEFFNNEINKNYMSTCDDVPVAVVVEQKSYNRYDDKYYEIQYLDNEWFPLSIMKDLGFQVFNMNGYYAIRTSEIITIEDDNLELYDINDDLNSLGSNEREEFDNIMIKLNKITMVSERYSNHCHDIRSENVVNLLEKLGYNVEKIDGGDPPHYKIVFLEKYSFDQN